MKQIGKISRHHKKPTLSLCCKAVADNCSFQTSIPKVARIPLMNKQFQIGEIDETKFFSNMFQYPAPFMFPLRICNVPVLFAEK